MIRQAIESDAPDIASVHVASWSETYAGLLPANYIASFSYTKRLEVWQAILSAQTKVFVYEAEGQIVGFVNGGKIREEKHPYKGEIYSLYLLKNYHHRGIGKQLFDHVVLSLKSETLIPFTTWVLADNKALSFYLKSGAKIIDERFEMIDGTRVRDLQLGWV